MLKSSRRPTTELSFELRRFVQIFPRLAIADIKRRRWRIRAPPRAPLGRFHFWLTSSIPTAFPFVLDLFPINLPRTFVSFAFSWEFRLLLSSSSELSLSLLEFESLPDASSSRTPSPRFYSARKLLAIISLCRCVIS